MSTRKQRLQSRLLQEIRAFLSARLSERKERLATVYKRFEKLSISLTSGQPSKSLKVFVKEEGLSSELFSKGWFSLATESESES